VAVRKMKRGSMVYTVRLRSYDALMFCGYRHMKVDHDVRFSRGKVHINGMEGFWCYAKERLIKHHGVSPRKFARSRSVARAFKYHKGRSQNESVCSN
jgi:transposase